MPVSKAVYAPRGTSAETALGLSTVYEVLCEALINVPSASIVGDVRRVARLFGTDAFEGIGASAQLEQRFYDRFFIPISPVFVPLSESRIEGCRIIGGKRSFGPAVTGTSRHVEALCEQTGFDFRALEGFDSAVQRLSSDSLAAELAFLAFLRMRFATGSCAYERFAAVLLDRHTAWVEKAAAVMEGQDDDFYARLVRLAAQILAADRETTIAAHAGCRT